MQMHCGQQQMGKVLLEGMNLTGLPNCGLIAVQHLQHWPRFKTNFGEYLSLFAVYWHIFPKI